MGDVYIAEGGKSRYWFLGSAVPKLRGILSRDPAYAVVIMMGVNDCTNRAEGAKESYSAYAVMFKELKETFPKTRFFFCSVNPVDEKYRVDKTFGMVNLHLSKDSFNAVIDTFNTHIQAACAPGEYPD